VCDASAERYVVKIALGSALFRKECEAKSRGSKSDVPARA
jgi:hypothetical protein